MEDQYQLRGIRTLGRADALREARREELIAWCKREIDNRKNNRLKYDKTTSTEATKVWGYTSNGVSYLQNEMECFDLNLDTVLNFYMPIATYIKTMNACDGRLNMRLLETLDEGNKQYLLYLKLKLPWPVKDRSGLVVYNLGVDNGKTNFMHTEGLEYYYNRYANLFNNDDV